MTYLAVTASNRTEINDSAPIAVEESARTTDAEPPIEGSSIRAIASQTNAKRILFEARTDLETEPLATPLISTRHADVVAQSLRNEGGSTADQLLSDHRANEVDR
jgi:hypothetical protein